MAQLATDQQTDDAATAALTTANAALTTAQAGVGSAQTAAATAAAAVGADISDLQTFIGTLTTS